jgi:hypothetical protein
MDPLESAFPPLQAKFEAVTQVSLVQT